MVSIGLLIAVLTVGAYNLCYRIGDIAPYYLSIWMVGSALLSVALQALQDRWERPWRHPAVAAIVCSVLVGMPLVRNWRACDLSRATWVREFARQKLESTDPGGVLISELDSDTFPIWYDQEALHIRPDVLNVDRALLRSAWLHHDRDPSLWYLYYLRKRGANLAIQAPRDRASVAYLANDGCLVQLIGKALRGRPLCLTFSTTGQLLSGDPRMFVPWVQQRYEQLPQGIVLSLHPKNQPVNLAALLRRNERLWREVVLPDLSDVRLDQDLSPDYIVNHYAYMLLNFGHLHELAGDRSRAALLYRRTVEWAPNYQPAVAALLSLHRTAGAPHGRRPASL
jgi:hypothetical protein